jgi:ribosomal protein L15
MDVEGKKEGWVGDGRMGGQGDDGGFGNVGVSTKVMQCGKCCC